MSALCDDFIAVFPGAFSAAFCDSVISRFSDEVKNNRTWGRSSDHHVKNDRAVTLNKPDYKELAEYDTNIGGLIDDFNSVFWGRCYTAYTKKYSVLNDAGKHTVRCYKVQKTEPSGGYHVWHYEDSCVELSRRIAVYILYLNTVTDGGETEFLYMRKRIQPEKGTLVIFPSNYPWTHRGNPPLSESKYIMTGWVEYC